MTALTNHTYARREDEATRRRSLRNSRRGRRARMSLGSFCPRAECLHRQRCAAESRRQPPDDFARNCNPGAFRSTRLPRQRPQRWKQLERHPSSVEGYNLLGIIQTEQHDYAGALEAFKKALKIYPQFREDVQQHWQRLRRHEGPRFRREGLSDGAASESGEPGWQLRSWCSADDGGTASSGHSPP